jgi:hypothetical protein
MFSFSESRAILESTPATLSALLGRLPAPLLRVNEGPGTWNALQVVCHLIHGETDDWIPRIRLILEKGASEPFVPFDRVAGFIRYDGWTIDALLAEFARLRHANLATVDGLSLHPSQLSLEGLHPELGRVTLEQLLACWVTHDMAHVCQISRTLTRHHGKHVGPWKKFFSVLRDAEPAA